MQREPASTIRKAMLGKGSADVILHSGRVALDDYVDLVAKLRAKQGGGSSGPTIPGRPGAPSQKKAVLGGATGSSSHTIDQEESVASVPPSRSRFDQCLRSTGRASSRDTSMASLRVTAILAIACRYLPIRCSSSTRLGVCPNPAIASEPRLTRSAPSDGLILCKLINDSVPDTIDERVLNKTTTKTHRRIPSQPNASHGAGGAPKALNNFQMTENNNIVIQSAKAIGCSVVNIGSADIIEGREHLVLGLIWQIIRRGLLSKIDIKLHPELYRLLEDGESLDQFLRLPPDQILLRWFNFHLKAANWPKRYARPLITSIKLISSFQSKQFLKGRVRWRKLYGSVESAQAGPLLSRTAANPRCQPESGGSPTKRRQDWLPEILDSQVPRCRQPKAQSRFRGQSVQHLAGSRGSLSLICRRQAD